MRKTSELVVGLCFLVIGVVFVAGAFKLTIGKPTEPQPGFFPFLGGIALIALSLLFLGMAWLGRTGECQRFGRLSGPAAVVIALGFYVVFLEKLGFVIGTALVAAVVLKVLDTPLKILLPVSIALPVIGYLLFNHLLGVTLPAGLLTGIF